MTSRMNAMLDTLLEQQGAEWQPQAPQVAAPHGSMFPRPQFLYLYQEETPSSNDETDDRR